MTQLEETVQGRLELCINSAWGTVCQDEFFDAFDAGIVCSQLGGYHSEGILFSNLDMVLSSSSLQYHVFKTWSIVLHRRGVGQYFVNG